MSQVGPTPYSPPSPPCLPYFPLFSERLSHLSHLTLPFLNLSFLCTHRKAERPRITPPATFFDEPHLNHHISPLLRFSSFHRWCTLHIITTSTSPFRQDPARTTQTITSSSRPEPRSKSTFTILSLDTKPYTAQ